MDVSNVLAAHGIGTAQGTATAAQVLTGYTFSSTAVIGKAGSMPNNGSPTLQPGAAISPGYYSGGGAAAPGTGSQTFNTPGNFSWTVPSGVTRVLAHIWGGGGGGGASNGGSYGGGGGAGGNYTAAFYDVTPGQTISVVVGTGGAAQGYGGGASGGTGAQSSFAGIASLGGAGGGGSTSTAPGVGSFPQTPSPSNQYIIVQGNPGSAGSGADGGNGGSAAPAYGQYTGGAGGAGSTSNANGGGGSQPGGGGGGGSSFSGSSSGGGGDGMVIVQW